MFISYHIVGLVELVRREPTMSSEKVGIIGGGISGLCSALILQKVGIPVEVYECEASRPYQVVQE